jgi:hypothetical protein
VSEIAREVVARVVAAAHRAPTADNCQPWSFGWDGRALAVHHDADRARNVLNHRDCLSHETLGMLLASLDVAAAAERLRAEAAIRLDGAVGAPWATVRFAVDDGVDPGLLPALLARTTDRRLYPRGVVRGEVVEALRREAAGSPGCGVHFDDRLSEELLAFVAEADAYPWRLPDAYRDVLRWMRFSPRELAASGDGVGYWNMGVSLPRLPGLSLTRSRIAQRLADTLRLYALSGAWARAQVRASSLLVLFTVRAAGPQALVDAGRLAMRAWLRLHAAGCAVQPFTLPTLLIYTQLSGGLPAGAPPDLGALYARGREVLRRAFSHPGGELPVWLLRVGPARPVPADLISPRRPLGDVLSFG